jgi:hypothetical protein
MCNCNFSAEIQLVSIVLDNVNNVEYFGDNVNAAATLEKALRHLPGQDTFRAFSRSERASFS